MIYNKFKQGFFRNLLAYAMMVIFLILTVLLILFINNPVGIVASIIGFGLLILFFVYDLFLSDVFVFKDDCFCTNQSPYNNPKYTPKLFGKVFVQFNAIAKIEKCLWDNKHFVLIIHLKDEEPLQYIFPHKNTRDFIFDKLSELTK